MFFNQFTAFVQEIAHLSPELLLLSRIVAVLECIFIALRRP